MTDGAIVLRWLQWSLRWWRAICTNHRSMRIRSNNSEVLAPPLVTLRMLEGVERQR
jgi:hypothetical protein